MNKKILAIFWLISMLMPTSALARDVFTDRSSLLSIIEFGVVFLAAYQLAFYFFVKNQLQVLLELHFIGWGLYLFGILSPLSKSVSDLALNFDNEYWNFVIGAFGVALLMYVAKQNPTPINRYVKPFQLGMIGFFGFSVVIGLGRADIALTLIASPIPHIILAWLIAASWLSNSYIHYKYQKHEKHPHKINWLPELFLGCGWGLTLLAILLGSWGTNRWLPVGTEFYLVNIIFMVCSPILIIQLGGFLRNVQQQRSEAMDDVLLEKDKVLLEKDKVRRITDTADKFIPKQFLELLSKKEVTEIHNGEAVERNLTVLFSDICTFTRLSANMSPEENFEFLNNYFNGMGNIVYRHSGFIDKFIGDAIMAIFGRQPEDAIECAILLQRWLRLYNLLRKDKNSNPIITGIGINSGPTMIGVLGTNNRLDSTVIGDTVNSAFHVEALTRFYDAKILITENTYQGLKNPAQFPVRNLGSTHIKGHNDTLNIYEVLAGDPPDIRNKKISLTPYYETAIVRIKENKYEDALALLKKCLVCYPQDKPSCLQIDRCIKGIQEQKTASHYKISTSLPIETTAEYPHTKITGVTSDVNKPESLSDEEQMRTILPN